MRRSYNKGKRERENEADKKTKTKSLSFTAFSERDLSLFLRCLLPQLCGLLSSSGCQLGRNRCKAGLLYYMVSLKSGYLKSWNPWPEQSATLEIPEQGATLAKSSVYLSLSVFIDIVCKEEDVRDFPLFFISSDLKNLGCKTQTAAWDWSSSAEFVLTFQTRLGFLKCFIK